jgi:glycosyltransferase involved in cell wall biosynthesis
VSAPRFSVVIAAYQAAGFIGVAVRSALEQVPPPHEVIVADDGSTDDLAAALVGFGDAVHVVRITHGGEAAAKNAGAGVATGDFIAFLDADDRFLPGRLAALSTLAVARPELDVITTDAYLIHDGEIVGRCYGPGHRFASGDQRTAILQRNFVLGLSAVRRSRFAEVGGFDPTVEYTTDWELWMRLILSGSEVGFIDEPLAEYRLHAGSMSARRAAMSRGRLTSLARAEARTDLSVDERATLAETRRTEEARLRRDELKERLLDSPPSGARRAALRVAVAPRQSLSARLKSVVALGVPGLVSRRLRASERGSFVTVGDRRLPL